MLGAQGIAAEIPLKEAGPLTEKKESVLEQAPLPVYRIQSFGKGEGKLALQGVGEGILLLEGPFASANEADETPFLKGKLESFSQGEHPVSLENGIYRVYGASVKAMKGELNGLSQFTVSYRCLSGCGRPTLDLKGLMEFAREPERVAAVKQVAAQLLAKGILNKEVLERVTGTINNLDKLTLPARFPVLPSVNEVDSFSAGLPSMHQEKIRESLADRKQHVQKDWDTMDQCDFDRSQDNRPIHPALQDVSYGHYIDDKVSKCQITQSLKLANILSELAIAFANNGEKSGLVITVEKNQTVNSPMALLKYLLHTGHSIQRVDEATYANFLSLRVRKDAKEYDAQIPVWIYTGLRTAKNEEIVNPMGHSQYSWRVFGPKLSARVSFFLGTDGVGFFPQIDARPIWTGLKVRNTERDAVKVRDSIVAAVDYVRVNQHERGDLAADGYLKKGVCNDSTAFLQVATGTPASTYPNVRERKGESPQEVGDDVARVFSGIPRDVGLTKAELQAKTYQQNASCRLLQMVPFPLDSPLFLDATLQRQLNDLADTGLRGRCVIP